VKASLSEMFDALGSTANVTYIVADDWRITRTNDAWHSFARLNGGARWETGASLIDVIPPALLPFYQSGFARASESGDRWEHDYECSSPELFRRFRMLAYPFGQSFLITHSLLVETPHPSALFRASAAYEREGFITMCAHCRRVRTASGPERWDWVPDYLRADQSRTTHGLCSGCFTYYYELS
jgi:hypothetical protein